MKYIGFKNYYEPNLYQEELNEVKDSSINENLSFLDSDNYNIISNKPTSYHDINIPEIYELYPLELQIDNSLLPKSTLLQHEKNDNKNLNIINPNDYSNNINHEAVNNFIPEKLVLSESNNRRNKSNKNENNKHSIQKGNNFLNKKRKEEIIFVPLKIPKNITNSIDNTAQRNILIANDKKKNRPGKKRKNNLVKRRHDKWDSSNIINKIKRSYFNYIRDIIKNNSINKDIEIKKIGNNFMENLTKKTNMVLNSTKLKTIFSDIEISHKYKKFNKEYNKTTIENIYNEGKETNIIKILNLTFDELFIIFRRKLNFYKDRKKVKDIEKKIEGLDLLKNDNYKDIQYLFESVRNKYKNLQVDEVEKYIIKLNVLCCCYQQWFINKLERNPKKNNKNNKNN